MAGCVAGADATSAAAGALEVSNIDVSLSTLGRDEQALSANATENVSVAFRSRRIRLACGPRHSRFLWVGIVIPYRLTQRSGREVDENSSVFTCGRGPNASLPRKLPLGQVYELRSLLPARSG